MQNSKKRSIFAHKMEIQRHIEILLLDNECVVVPDFGGFMTHEVPAHYDEEDHLFLPPLRTLGFNPQLRMNDSVLAQSYVEAYDISYPEALRRIEQEVKSIKKVLSDEGSYLLESIGTLSVNQEGNYEFSPCEAGILSPNYFGLDSFAFNQLKDQKEEKVHVIPVKNTESHEHPALLDFTDNPDDTEDKAITIKMSWIRNSVAVAAAIVAFVLMATPIANSELATRTMSHLQQNIFYRLMPKDTNTIPAQPIINQEPAKVKAPVVMKKEVADQEKTVEKEEVPMMKPQDSYCIVLASQVKKSNAEYYVEQLHKKGLDDARVYIHGRTVRVVCGNYKTEGEAYRHLNKINSKPEFEEAWVYKMKAEG